MSWLQLGEDVAFVCKGQIRLGGVVALFPEVEGRPDLKAAVVRTCEGNDYPVWSSEEDLTWARGWLTPAHNALVALLALVS